MKSFKYNSHYWLLSLVNRQNKPLRILDVGTADGYLGAHLKQHGHQLVGVEKDAASAEKARCHYEAFHHCDIEDFDFPYRNEFDVVLFADVLEHLRKPEDILRRCLPCLKSTGQVIVSVPNIANIFVRLGLLFGRFDYTERGILDRTHLRFFTLSTLQRMCRKAGYKILDTTPTPVPVQLVVAATNSAAFAPLHELHYLLVRVWKTLLAYQFVLRLEADR